MIKQSIGICFLLSYVAFTRKKLKSKPKHNKPGLQPNGGLQLRQDRQQQLPLFRRGRRDQIRHQQEPQ